MGRRVPRIFSFLVLLCQVDGQFGRTARFGWEDRFISIDKFWKFQPTEKPASVEELSSYPRFTLVAPDLLRADSQENIYLQAYSLSNPIEVLITIKDFTKTSTLLRTSITLGPENDFHALKTIELPSENLNRDETANKFVYLKVVFTGFHSEERVMMVTFHSGYIFIQTDRPVYNPGDTVQFRAFVSSPDFKAFDTSIIMDIQSPDGVVVDQVLRSRAKAGIFSDTYTLSDHVSEGTWTMTGKFDHWKQNTFSSTFEVKKYVLPAFNVTLTPRTMFFNLDDDELEVEISAKYLYGKPVHGTAYVVFGVETTSGMTRFPSVKQVSDLNGGVVRLSMEEIRRAYRSVRSLVGHSLYVKASVLTTAGGDLVEAEKKGIKIVESPYVVSFKDIPKYYKPGLTLDFSIHVSLQDGSPAHNVPVKLNVLDVPVLVVRGIASVSIEMRKDQQPQSITAETTQAGLRPEQQAKHQVVLQPYMTFNSRQQNYIYISSGSNTVSVGERLILRLHIAAAEPSYKDAIKQITYLVINKGKIIDAQRLDVSGQVMTTVLLKVTEELKPSFRVVAFYILPWTRQEEVVADSVWVDVEDSCGRGLKVGPLDGVHRDHTPGRSFNLEVKGEPGAKVSLLAVDNAVFLLKKDRLTQRKIWDVVESGDMGCTRGGGRDAMRVFTDAGLLYASSAGSKTDTRTESQYKEKLQRRCCKDGLREIPMPYSCTRRSLYITEGWECMRAFRHCCSVYRDQVFDTQMPTTPPPTTPPPTTPPPTTTAPAPVIQFHRFLDVERLFAAPAKASPGVTGSKGRLATEVVTRIDDKFAKFQEKFEEKFEDKLLDEFEDETQVYQRHRFFETWLWMDVDLPSAAGRDGLASKNVYQVLPDSITEWGVLAVSASPQTGFCVAEPYNFRAWKRFFVDLKLPHSVARNEQVEIKAVVHNYGFEDLDVTVVLMKTEHMCSLAFKNRHAQRLKLPAGSSTAVSYIIVPLVVEKLPVEVMVVGGDDIAGDRVLKFLQVVREGVQKTKVWSAVLNPSSATQTIVVRKFDLEGLVPNSEPETFINIRGNVLADSIDNSIREDALAALIRMPGGCVEQNLASIALTLISSLYLDRSGNWEHVGVERKAEALRYIRKGYETQLAFKKPDGSYPPYSKEGASTWITAYVVKVFSMAHSIFDVKEQVCGPLMYLVQETTRPSVGGFVERNPVYSTTMTGGLRGDDPEMTLSAFVLIALAEARKAGINCTGGDQESVIRSTADYLTTALGKTGRRPYTVAITSYALALLGNTADLKQHLLGAAADGSHWPDKENHLFTLEATGYALLALVKLGHQKEATAAFNWLNEKRRRGGGFGSTQSTMVVLQALSEYLINYPPPEDLSLDVDIKGLERRDLRYHFNPKTAYGSRSSRLSTNVDLEVVATGNGQGILEVVTHYNQLHEVAEKELCKDFELSVAIEESSEKPPADIEKSHKITIRVRALGPSDVRMVVLDITLPTGFTPENSDLELLSNSVDRYINNFQIVDNLSDRGSLIIHLFKVSHKEQQILIFRLQQNFKVSLLQPSSVTVYEYYNPDHRCSQLYTPVVDKDELTQICEDTVCRCTQGDCCTSKRDEENFSKEDRVSFACKSLHHVFKVEVLDVVKSYYDKYEMEVKDVMKLGVEAGVHAGQKRFFMSHGNCRGNLNLQVGSQYLIIGPKEDQWIIEDRSLYMLGENTWVERWPSSAECSSNPSLKTKCKNLEETASLFSRKGCVG